MARFDRYDVIPAVVAALVVAALLVWAYIALVPPASAAVETFDHSNCQYPERWSNPPNGCDNSDPAVPECIKGISTESAEKACIDAFVKRYNDTQPISTPTVDPTASQGVSVSNPVSCTGKQYESH